MECLEVVGLLCEDWAAEALCEPGKGTLRPRYEDAGEKMVGWG